MSARRSRALVFVLAAGVPAASAVPQGSPRSSGDDAEEVHALITERCLRCHGPKRQKGKLRLDRPEQVLGVVTPGAADASELYRRITLPIEDLDVMPPEEPWVSAPDQERVRRWIDAGASLAPFERGTAGEAADRAMLESVRVASGARVAPDGTSAGGLRVDWSLSDAAPEAEQLAALAPIAGRVHELSLAGQVVSAQALKGLPPLPALERLHLQRAQVDDATLAALLQRTPAVRSLNLYSTAVTSESVPRLAGLERLVELVVHDTPLESAAADLRAALPHVIVTVTASLPARPFGNEGPRRVLVADASRGRIALLRETALEHFDLEWEHPIQALHDLQWLPDERVLFQETWTRLVEVDTRTGATVWSYEAAERNREPGDGPVEVHAFQRLEGGVTLIAESGPARILEVDRAGKVLRNVPLTVDQPHAHHDTRLVRKTPAGTYLVAHEADGVVREYDATGELVWSYAVPLFGRERAGGHGLDAFGNQTFAALRLPGGTTLITTGNGHSVLEVDAAGEIVWRLEQDDLEGVRLAWVTTVQVLANGNLVLGNCHAGEEQPQLVELTRDGRVVWRFRDFERMGNALSNAWVIEDLGHMGADR